MEKLTLNPKETSKELGIGLNKVYELIHNNTIPSVRIGRRLLIPIQSLKNWLISSAGGIS